VPGNEIRSAEPPKTGANWSRVSFHPTAALISLGGLAIESKPPRRCRSIEGSLLEARLVKVLKGLPACNRLICHQALAGRVTARGC
jgi:hypothetical protein